MRTEDRGPGICEEVAVGSVWVLGGAGNNTDAGRGWEGRPARLEGTDTDPGASPANSPRSIESTEGGASARGVRVRVRVSVSAARERLGDKRVRAHCTWASPV